MKTTACRRDFLGGLAASLAAAGCRSGRWFAETPNLRFGVVSDIHVTTPESTRMFRCALAYFRDEGVDAVVVAGDLSDWGLRSGFGYVAEAWREVFPCDRAPDGRKVEKLFVTGNHDFEGWGYGDMTLDMHVQGYSEDEALVRLGMKKCWEEAFHEPYADIRRRTVKGYDFIGAEWHVGESKVGDAETAAWFGRHAEELQSGRPFFFFRHAPLPNTVSSAMERGGDPQLTDALRKFPDCIAFNGHTHWTLNDERSIWQEEFTAISVPSLSYTTVPKGYENGRDSRVGDSKLGMARLASRENLQEAQGYLVSVFDDRMEVGRYDFECGEEAATPWVVPLVKGRDKPYAAARHAAATPVPQFPEGASVKTYVTNSDTRNARWTIFMTLEFPAAFAPEGGRVFDYEARVEFENGGTGAVKRFLSPAFHRRAADEPSVAKFWFDAADLPEYGRYRLAVYPRNCFGVAGSPIRSRVYESKPGKEKVSCCSAKPQCERRK